MENKSSENEEYKAFRQMLKDKATAELRRAKLMDEFFHDGEIVTPHFPY